MTFLRSVAFAFLLALIGCVSLESTTSGAIGCPPADIKITKNETNMLGQAHTWTAECHGKTFYCSAQGGGQNTAPVAVCKEAVKERSEAQSAAPGCQYDAQCKSDRICRAGVCVDP